MSGLIRRILALFSSAPTFLPEGYTPPEGWMLALCSQVLRDEETEKDVGLAYSASEDGRTVLQAKGAFFQAIPRTKEAVEEYLNSAKGSQVINEKGIPVTISPLAKVARDRIFQENEGKRGTLRKAAVNGVDVTGEMVQEYLLGLRDGTLEPPKVVTVEKDKQYSAEEVAELLRQAGTVASLK